MNSARRHVELMVLPLGVIAVCLLASVLVPYGSPLAWMTVTTPLTDLSPFLLIHVSAALTAFGIVRASRRDVAPDAFAVVAVLLGIIAATVMTAWAVKVFADANAWTPVLAFVAPLCITPVLAFHALRVRGWDRMLGLVGAFAVAALPYSCPLVPGMFNLFSGGLVYLLAVVTLLVLFGRGLATHASSATL
ncbi:MAG: hypothetical protein ABI678_17510 [Kofleriaceae bacterium]